MQSLSGCHVDSVCKWGNHKSGSIAKIFVRVFKACVSNSDQAVVLWPVELKLTLPLELLWFTNVFLNQLVHQISTFGVHGNETHQFLPHGFAQIASNHPNELREQFNRFFVEVLERIHVSIGYFDEAFFNASAPDNVIDQQGNLGRISFNPLFPSHRGLVLERSSCEFSQ